MNKYTTEGRLADVIALITLLAVDSGTFRTIPHLDKALRGSPRSVKKWDDLAELHPEFFRFNGGKDTIALLIRSYLPEDADGKRPPLSIEETQKLIDTAIALHDKEILFKQRNTYWFPFVGSLLVAIIAVVGGTCNNKTNNTTSKKTDTLYINLRNSSLKTDTMKK